MTKPIILIVEDEPAQVALLSYNLKAEGYEVLEADNGDYAQVLVEENKPDLILLDWMLPKTSGIELCRRIKQRKDTKTIQILARTRTINPSENLNATGDDKCSSMLKQVA